MGVFESWTAFGGVDRRWMVSEQSSPIRSFFSRQHDLNCKGTVYDWGPVNIQNRASLIYNPYMQNFLCHGSKEQSIWQCCLYTVSRLHTRDWRPINRQAALWNSCSLQRSADAEYRFASAARRHGQLPDETSLPYFTRYLNAWRHVCIVISVFRIENNVTGLVFEPSKLISFCRSTTRSRCLKSPSADADARRSDRLRIECR